MTALRAETTRLLRDARLMPDAAAWLKEVHRRAFGLVPVIALAALKALRRLKSSAQTRAAR